MERMLRFLLVCIIGILCGMKPASAACGDSYTALGSFNGITAYSNGSNTGSGYGDCQCVDYVKRFHDIEDSLTGCGECGAVNAYTYVPANYSNFTSYANGGTTQPKPGDILGFGGGTYGHVAIISEVGSNYIVAIDQNRSASDAFMECDLAEVSGTYTVSNCPMGDVYYVQGWIRNSEFVNNNAEEAIDEKIDVLEPLGVIDYVQDPLHWYNLNSSTYLMENWTGGTWGDMAIVYNSDDDRAYTIRDGFRQAISTLSAYGFTMGVPLGDEMDVDYQAFHSENHSDLEVYDNSGCHNNMETCVLNYCADRNGDGVGESYLADDFTSMQRFDGTTMCWHKWTWQACVSSANDIGAEIFPVCETLDNWGFGGVHASSAYYPFIHMDSTQSDDLYDYTSLIRLEDDTVRNYSDETPTYTGRPSATVAIRAGDVNGDGIDDIVRVTSPTASTSTRHAFVHLGGGNGEVGERENWKTMSLSTAHDAFVGDYNGDGYDDLILAFDTGTNSKLEWKVCTSTGSAFASSCTLWQTDSGDDTFGQTTDTFVVADFNGNGQVEILRGRLNTGSCTTSMKWKRLNTNFTTDVLEIRNGVSGSTGSCFGYDGSTFLADDVDNDGSDELVYLRTTDSSVETYVADYSNSNKRLTHYQWASDVGGEDGTYCLSDLSGNGYLDLVRWGSSTLNYSVNNGSSFQEQTSQTKVMNLNQGSNDYLLCGSF